MRSRSRTVSRSRRLLGAYTLLPQPRRPQRCGDPRLQLARGERLDEVAVRTRRQPLDRRFFTGAGGEEDHWDVPRARVGA